MHPRTLHDGFGEEEFLSLPESHDRIELLDGEVILSPSPTYAHQRIVAELLRHLMAWADAHPPAAVGLSPLDVRLGDSRILQPDLFIVRDGIPADLQGPVRAIPDLVVEVTSENRSYDRMTKRLAYAEAGVPEYWIVDRRERRLELIQGLETVLLVESGPIRSMTLPDLGVPLSALFAHGG